MRAKTSILKQKFEHIQPNVRAAVVVGVSAAIVGIVLFAVSASGQVITVKPDSATGAARIVDAEGATGNKALLFGAAPAPGTDAPARLFTEDFEGDNLNQWLYKACPSAITLSGDVARDGVKSAKYVVAHDHTKSRCPESRGVSGSSARLVSNYSFEEGEYFIGFSTLFPSGFGLDKSRRSIFNMGSYNPVPTSENTGIGATGRFAPTAVMRIESDNRLKLYIEQDTQSGYEEIWSSAAPIVLGQTWQDIVLRVMLSPEPGAGFIELWHNNGHQTLKGGAKRFQFTTLNQGVNWEPENETKMWAHLDRDATPESGVMTMYFDEISVGKTYESVAR